MDNTNERISHDVHSDPVSAHGRRTSEQGEFANNNLLINYVGVAKLVRDPGWSLG